MFLLMFAAIGGGLGTASVMAPFGAGVAALCAPFGGSLCAVLAAAYLTRHRGRAEEHGEVEAHTDTMVANLRDLAVQGTAAEADPAGQTSGRARAA